MVWFFYFLQLVVTILLDHVIYLGGEDDNVQLFAIETCEHGEHPQPFKVLAITKEVWPIETETGGRGKEANRRREE